MSRVLCPAQGGCTALRAAADECKEERGLLLVTAQGFLQRALRDLLVVADPRGECDKRRREPVLGRAQHQFLTRCADCLLPHDGKVIRLQYSLCCAADDGVMSILLLELLPQLHETGFRQLCPAREFLCIHECVEVLRQLLEIVAQTLDLAADGNHIPIRCVDIVAQFPQTIRDMRQIRLRDHPITHTFPFFLPMIRDDYSIDCRFREAGNDKSSASRRKRSFLLQFHLPHGFSRANLLFHGARREDLQHLGVDEVDEEELCHFRRD